MRLVNGLVLPCLLVGCLVFLAACEKRTTPVDAGAAEPIAAAPAQAEPRVVALYDAGVLPLKTEQCGQCHFPVYDAIRNEGGKHKIDCVRCHEKYHAYSPRKQNFAEIMPKCGTCHPGTDGGDFHGVEESLKDCLKCHEDPHRPLIMVMDDLSPECANCHKPVSTELAMNPSAHSSAVDCDDCHADRHGSIPQCADCHESHSPEAQMGAAECMTCHPVHKPTAVTYSEDVSNAICAGCHADAQHKLSTNVTKHTSVPCAECHTEHKGIAPCSKCHGQPHSKTLMQDTSKCGDCHGAAHALAAG